MAKKNQQAIGGAAQVVRTTFDGLPIVDAIADFSLVVRTQHVNAAKGAEKDATNCILAKACASQVGSSKVAFFRSVAYLELPGPDGKRRVVRYMLDDSAAAIVRAFDSGKSVKGEVMVTLRAPTGSQTLDRILVRSRRQSKKKAATRKAVLKGEFVESPSSQFARGFQKPKVTGIDVRNGVGLVHNTVKKAAK